MKVEWFEETYNWKKPEDLYKICIEQQQEIERLTKQNKALNEMYELTKKEYIRLNKQIEEYQKALDETTSEKIDLENIIKEVRELVENKYIGELSRKILEILDKESK